MSVWKSPTPAGPWPSTDTTMTILVSDGVIPAVSASASIIHGTESVFARVEVDTLRPGGPARHAARFALIGPRAVVVAVLRDLRAAVDAAQPPEPGEQQ